jgi:hypothetical protein
VGHRVTLHYHATPITPLAVLHQLAGRCFVVSFERPEQVAIVHRIGQAVMLDNGAYTAWTRGGVVDWSSYYRWAEPWLDHPTTWAVIPDVINDDDDAAANDALLEQWPHGVKGAPVWHMHEPVGRLCRLSEKWPRVCIGSSDKFRVVGSAAWHDRMIEAMNVLCGDDGPPPVWLHMLRALSLGDSIYPFASLDGSDVARNHNRAHNSPIAMALKWDALQCPARWRRRSTQTPIEFGGAPCEAILS